MTKRNIIILATIILAFIAVQSVSAQVQRHICSYHGWEEIAIEPEQMERGEWIFSPNRNFWVRVNAVYTCYSPFAFTCGLALTSEGEGMRGYTYQPYPPNEWCEHTFPRDTTYAEIRSTDCGGPELRPQYIIICYDNDLPRPSLFQIFMAAVSKFFDRIIPGYPGPGYPGYPGQQSGPPVPTLPSPIQLEVTQ